MGRRAAASSYLGSSCFMSAPALHSPPFSFLRILSLCARQGTALRWRGRLKLVAGGQMVMSVSTTLMNKAAFPRDTFPFPFTITFFQASPQLRPATR